MAGEKSVSLKDKTKEITTNVGLALLPFFLCLAIGLGPIVGAAGTGIAVSGNKSK